MLIVLDNCEHLIGGCAKTADAIVRRCPKVHLVATSREPLRIGGETIYRVPPLSLPAPGDTGVAAAESSDAVALFVDRARAQGSGLPVDETTAPLVVSICARLDGLPLAIELAAARLRSLSLTALACRLDQRFGLLTGGSRTALARQQTRQATVGWSYSLLNRAEQLLLGPLPVFAESFDLDAAEAVCGLGGIQAPDVTGLLGSLVDKSLVVADPAGPALRYRLLETIRQFAADRLAESGETEAAALAAAHCAHYLGLAQTAAPYLTGPDQGSWLTRLDADQANLRRAAEHAASRPDGTAQVLRFGVALWKYWSARSRNEEAAGLLVPVLRRPEAAADPALFAEALVFASTLTLFTDMPTSVQLAEKADEVAGRLGDDRLLALARGTLSCAYHFAGEPERALRLGDGGGRAGPAARRRLPAGLVPCRVRHGRRQGGPRAAVRRGFRLYRAFRRPWHEAKPSQQCRMRCLGDGGLPGCQSSFRSRDRGRGGNRNSTDRAVTEPGHRPAGGARPRRRAIRIPGSRPDRPPGRRQEEHGLRHPGAGVPGRRPGRLAPGSHAARRRASPARQDGSSVGTRRRAPSPGKPRPSTPGPRR